MLSPISNKLFMSWVFIIVVMLYSTVISLINSSIKREVMGSKPELGSSQNKYLGLSAIALAIPTRFFIPPLRFDGYSLFTFTMFTRCKQKFTRSKTSSGVILVNIFKGKAMLSSTLNESNKAVP